MSTIYRLQDLRDWKEVSRKVSPPIQLAVGGYPAGHSLSPQMQNPALEKTGLQLRYGTFETPPNDLEEAFRLVREHHFIGLNLTTPHKMAALSLVDETEERARQIGAINTIVFRDSKSLGANTDAPGFVR